MYNIETKLVQIGNGSLPKTGAINPPVYFSTAYRHSGIGETTGYDYIRTGNPTRQIVASHCRSGRRRSRICLFFGNGGDYDRAFPFPDRR